MGRAPSLCAKATPRNEHCQDGVCRQGFTSMFYFTVRVKKIARWVVPGADSRAIKASILGISRPGPAITIKASISPTRGSPGGLSFALWNNDVGQFIVNGASHHLQEFHVDGFRYDEISALLSLNENSGWSFCRDLTDTLRYVKPGLLQNAEYWPFEFQDYPQQSPLIVTPTASGTGCDRCVRL
jgi:hypothetical protein